jgi:hypothetical protein
VRLVDGLRLAAAADKTPVDKAEGNCLLTLLEGLLLAIAHAGAYLQEDEVGPKAYLRFYEQ